MPLYLWVTPGAVSVRCFAVERARLSCCLPSLPGAAIYTARLWGQGCDCSSLPGVALLCQVGACRLWSSGGLSGGRSTAVTLCGTGEALGKPLSQLVVSLKVQGPAQLSVTWWKRRHQSPAAEGGHLEQEAWPQQKPSRGCLQQLVSSTMCCSLLSSVVEASSG